MIGQRSFACRVVAAAKTASVLSTTVFALIGTHALDGAAQDLPDTSTIHGEAMLGAMYSTDARNHGVLIAPRWQPVLELDIERGRFYAGTGHGVGVKAFASDRIVVGIGVDYRPGREESADARYQGLGSVSGDPVVAPYLEWTPFGPALTFYGDLSIAGRRAHGIAYTAGARGGLPITGRLTAFVDASVAGADKNFAQTFYGITANQAVASGLPPHAAHAGLISGTVATGLLVDIGAHCQLIVSVGRLTYASRLAQSPLITQRRYPVGLVAANYSF